MAVGRATGLCLLFAEGKRPDRAAIREFVASQGLVSLTFDPKDEVPLHLVAANGNPVGKTQADRLVAGKHDWVELLKDGLAFDLIGIKPGESCAIPQVDHWFDFDQDKVIQTYDCLTLVPGQHLAGGANTIPVVQGLLDLARDILHHFDDLEGVIWEPASAVIGRKFFESTITAWLEGGAFPALGLTSFKETADGAVQSVGLDWWIGQELRIEPPLSTDRVAATRLGVRLINQLILLGGLEGSERLTAPDGSRLVMRTSPNGNFVRVAPD